MKISDVRGQFNALVNRVYRRETRVVVEKSGIPVAALVSLEDLARLKELDQAREEDFRILDEVREAFADVSPEELEREANRAVAEVRADRRASRQRSSAAAS
jgi:prevent-host-death family protein